MPWLSGAPTHMWRSRARCGRDSYVHILSPTHMLTHTLSRSGSMPYSKAHVRVCLRFAHTSTPVLIHVPAVIYNICAMSQVCTPGHRHTHASIHTCMHKGLCVLHTQRNHMCCREACTPRARCAHRAGLTSKIHTWWLVSHRHICTSVTQRRVSHTRGASLTYA